VITASEVLLAPADRLELAVGPFAEGEVLALEALTYSRTTIRKRKTERFATLKARQAKDHPFHLHGFSFQVLEVNGQPPAWRSWEDVVNVPPRSAVRIAWMPDDRTGSWMYHCHILEHHAAGMMAHFDVVS
jgi:Multicopper oxidase